LIFLKGQRPDIMAVQVIGRQKWTEVEEMEVGATFFPGHGRTF
jgi:hypothetical protein